MITFTIVVFGTLILINLITVIAKPRKRGSESRSQVEEDSPTTTQQTQDPQAEWEPQLDEPQERTRYVYDPDRSLDGFPALITTVAILAVAGWVVWWIFGILRDIWTAMVSSL